MSNLQRRTTAAYGIERWLSSKGYKVTNKTTADMTCAFLKTKGLQYMKFNPRYKGLWTPIVHNALDVQKYFNEFTQFILKNYPLTVALTENSADL
jgi:hypothetical protein